ncbi:DNA repair protein RecN [Gulosibacter molinativorax]|uniref:DNA repair protein RecN n=1 Tax=Gulosibacter molinativorax TaxID=256821 RepID=A0ABT7CB08_9MICO|nr:DNA repair protein RecN [Gulosibacter molinativorax]MDJ1372386.1 DNA repair protein RecN [Gulosibacter molinativorax]QUY61102.1 DNA repair protein RecN [Gulosibacter molinativorax]
MLEDIEIRGLGVIEQARLPLGRGFTAITGETGAGKTMVVTALGLVLGGRSSASAVRKDAERAKVEGNLVIDPAGTFATFVDEAGGEVEAFKDEDGEDRGAVVISRQIAKNGRSRAWLGGQSVPASTLVEGGELLVAIHGQSEQLRLTQEGAQRTALDEYGGEDAAAAIATLEERYDTLASLRAELERLSTSASDREAEREQLRELIDAVEAVNPEVGEDESLLQRIERLSNREQLRADIGGAHTLLAGEVPGGSLSDRVRDVRTSIDRGLRSDTSLDLAAENAADLEYAIDELAETLARYLADLDTDGVGELEALNDRLATLENLKRDHGKDLAVILADYEQAGIRLLELAGDDTRLPQLKSDVEDAQQALEDAATNLSEVRARAAEALQAEATEELRALAMPHAKLVVSVTPEANIRRHGRDRIEFLLEPHPGSDPTPLRTGASGGELSRVMLALEVVLASANPVPTLVFDEVDAGVGGAAALEIGARLQRLARSSQVIVVTHLAQVAAFADHHVRIEKSTSGGVTSSSIRELDESGRVEEMTRLLSGLTDSESGQAHAQELLRRAEEAGARVAR